MRINVLDLSRFCCASWDASERASEPGPGCFVFLYPSPSRAAPLFTHPFSLLDAPLRELRHTVERNTPTPGIFFPLACSQRISLSKSFPPPAHPLSPSSSSSSFSAFLPRSSFGLSSRLKSSLDVVVTGGEKRRPVFRCKDVRARIVWSASIKDIYTVNCGSSTLARSCFS